MRGLKLGVLVSGGGTNLQSIIDAAKNQIIASDIQVVISNKEQAYGLERARENGIPAVYLDPKDPSYDKALLKVLEEYGVELVVLAGYLKIVDNSLIERYPQRVINIHPSLLPKYGGKGYYGIHVHEAVIAHKEKESGATVHFVDTGIDTGKIILQEKLAVEREDNPGSLQKKILEQIEHHLLVDAIKLLEGTVEQ